MHQYRIVWEDESHAREVEVLVDYTLEAGVVTVDAIRPTQVTLYNADTKSIARTLPVWTETGRRVLTQAFLAARDEATTLADEILAQHQLRDEALATAVR